MKIIRRKIGETIWKDFSVVLDTELPWKSLSVIYSSLFNRTMGQEGHPFFAEDYEYRSVRPPSYLSEDDLQDLKDDLRQKMDLEL